MSNVIIQENKLCKRSLSKTTSIPLIDYLDKTNKLNSTCASCGKLLFPKNDRDSLDGFRIDERTLRLTKIVDGHIKGCIEPIEYRWLITGLQCLDSHIYRTVCWKCFWKNLRKRYPNPCELKVGNRKRNSWWMKVIEGQDCYPTPKGSAIGKDWADLLFTDTPKEKLEQLYLRYDTASLASFISRFGEIDGNKKYEEYVKFHSDKNKFEYKHEHLGWSKEQFDEFNISRSVTLDILVNRYGKEIGERKWKEYCDKQAYAGCKLEYFIEKYGDEEGTKKYKELNKLKIVNEDTFIRKYGEAEGKNRYSEFQLHHKSWSSISQELFNKIMEHIPSNEWNKVRYATMGGEGCIEGNLGFMFPDFIYDNKKIIEFNGDYWHKNPKLYSESDEGVNEKWKYDKLRLNELKRLGYDVMVVWEMDYKEDKLKTVDACLEFLGLKRI